MLKRLLSCALTAGLLVSVMGLVASRGSTTVAKAITAISSVHNSGTAATFDANQSAIASITNWEAQNAKRVVEKKTPGVNADASTIAAGRSFGLGSCLSTNAKTATYEAMMNRAIVHNLVTSGSPPGFTNHNATVIVAYGVTGTVSHSPPEQTQINTNVSFTSVI